jgi:probable rRNA maturation factor
VNDRRIKMLNRQYLGVDKTTDVLSFPQQELKTPPFALRTQNLNPPLPPFSKGRDRLATRGRGGIIRFELRTPHFVLGDIVINVQRAREQAVEQGITLHEELKRLIIHGLLHLIGYDHEKSRYQKKKMELKEKELLEALKSF